MMMRLALRGMLVAGLIGLAGCSTVGGLWDDWFGTSAKQQPPAPLVEFKPSADLKIAASASVGAAGNSVFAPAQWKGAIFAVGADGKLVRFDGAPGREAWRVDTGRKLSAGVGAGPALVVVGTLKGEVLAFDHGGKPAWQAKVSSEVLAAPAVTEDTVYVRSGDGRVFAFNAADGQRKWVYQRATPTLTVRSAAGVVVDRNGAFAGFGGGKLVALEASSGAVAWEASVALPRGVSELERIADVTSNPVIDGRAICAAAFQGRVACFDVNSGTPIWGRDLSSLTGVAVDTRNLYVADVKGAVHALDKARGASVWKQDKLSNRQLSGPLVYRGYVIVGDLQGYVHVLSREDGSFAARIATDGSPIRITPQATPDGILVQTLKGGVYLLSLN
jgi:outer membrane protein assembly factor BamB